MKKVILLLIIFTIIGCERVYTPKEHIRDVTDSFEFRCIRGKRYLYQASAYTDIYLLNTDDDGKPIKCE